MVSREVKFGALIKHLENDGQWLATGAVSYTLSSPYALLNYCDRDQGHYARKGWKTPPGCSIPRPQLLRSSDPTKDQNYYLSAIQEKGLERALFPLGELTKADVRKIAEASGIPTAQRGESMGICFVGQKRKFNEFLGEYLFVLFTPPRPPYVFALTSWIDQSQRTIWNQTPAGCTISKPEQPSEPTKGCGRTLSVKELGYKV